MALKDVFWPRYSKRIEELRRFRDEYNSLIARVSKSSGRVYVDLPESPEKEELAALNRDLNSRLFAGSDGHFIPANDKEDLLQEMEAIEGYTEDSIKMLKRRDLIWITVTVTFTILGVMFLRTLPI